MKTPTTVMCYGDSNTYGFNPKTERRYSSDIRWTGILQKELGPDYCIVEEGCNGRTAFAVPDDEPWKFGMYGLEACLNTHKPIHIFAVMLGSNDLKTNFDASVKDVADGVKAIVEKTKAFLLVKQEFEPEVLIISPAVLGDGFGEADHFDKESVAKSIGFAEAFKEVAKETGSYFMNAADFIESSKVDSLHLDPDAHAAFAKAIRQYICDI